MSRLVSTMLLISLCSCATFINKPEVVKKWKYDDIKNCPQTYKVSTEKRIEYYLRKQHIYSCDLIINDMPTSECKKRSSYFLDVPEKVFNSHHKDLLKKIPARYPCMVPTSAKEADFIVKIKSTVTEQTYVPLAFATGLTLGLIPNRTTHNTKDYIEIKNMKNGNTKVLQEEADFTLWVQLFLLPLMPFIGDGGAYDKIIAHMNSVVFETMNALEKSDLHK